MRLSYTSGSLSLVAGRRRAWLSRIWEGVDNGSKHSIYEETNRWIPQTWGSVALIAQCQAPVRPLSSPRPHVTHSTSSQIFTTIWEKLEQERIRRWIERIPRHIQKVLELEGGNEYTEGAEDKPRRHNFEGDDAADVDESSFSEAEAFGAFMDDLSDLEDESESLDTSSEASSGI